MSSTTKIQPTNKPKTEILKQWKVIVHNDDINTYGYVIKTFVDIVRLTEDVAKEKTTEVDEEGLSIVRITHKEHAELLQLQLQSKSLTVTIEPE